jgi:hypothetical protein
MCSLLFEHLNFMYLAKIIAINYETPYCAFFPNLLFILHIKIRTYSHTYIFLTRYKSSESLLMYFQRPGWSSNRQVFKFQMKNTDYAEHRPKSRSFKQNELKLTLLVGKLLSWYFLNVF